MEQEAVFHEAGSSALDPLVPGAGTAAVHWVRETPPETRGVTGLPGPCLGSKWLLCHMQWSVGIHTHTLALALFFPGNLLLDVILGRFSGLDEH